MDAIEAIMKRRSVRKYLDKQISAADLDTIVKAGQNAPNGYNRQAVYITAIHNADKLKELEKILKEVAVNLPSDPESIFFKEKWAENGSKLCYGAPTFVIVSAAPNSKFPEMDCAVCMENILVAATALGIASCFINTLFKMIPLATIKSVMADFGVPETHTIHCAAALGYSVETPAAPKRAAANLTIIS
ncbi:MAG: nitroreductase family protein [Alphaproteobacteria bacterium]|nr:nitroreductase family protein [Alphaproteobacteria bacterium]